MNPPVVEMHAQCMMCKWFEPADADDMLVPALALTHTRETGHTIKIIGTVKQSGVNLGSELCR